MRPVGPRGLNFAFLVERCGERPEGGRSVAVGVVDLRIDTLTFRMCEVEKQWMEPPGFSLGVAPERGNGGMGRQADGVSAFDLGTYCGGHSVRPGARRSGVWAGEDRAGPVWPMSAPYSSRRRTGRSRGCGP